MSWLSIVSDIAAAFPCGDVASVELVCNTCVILIGILFPPKYSGRCNLASGDDTPKCAARISMYRVLCYRKGFLSSTSYGFP